VLVTEVADSGPGIRPEVLPHIFDRFYKADSARTRSAGSGLGLAITLENVRLHGGTIRAGNRPEGGAVFTVGIPLHAEEAGG
jgi:two-component system sensor histidine kinase MtrB